MAEFIKQYGEMLATIFAAMIAAVALIIVAIINNKSDGKRKPSNDTNSRFKSNKNKKGLIPNNLPSLGSIGENLGKGRREKQLEIIATIREYRVVALEDTGGIGKSTLARNSAEVFLNSRKKEFDAIIWITAKYTQISFNDALDTIARTLDYTTICSLETTDAKACELIKILQKITVFFVFDNYETIDDKAIDTFIKSIPDHNRILITTRHGSTDIASDVKKVDVGKLNESDGREVIQKKLLREKSLAKYVNDETIKKIYTLTEGLPQAIIWLIGQLNDGLSIEAIEGQINSGRGDVFEKLFALSWGMLDDKHKEILRAMLFFITQVASKALFAATNLTNLEFSDAIAKLVRLSIIDANQEIEDEVKFYSMHSWTRLFSKNRLAFESDDEKKRALRLGKYYVNFCGKRHGKKRGLQGYDELEYELPNMLKAIGTIEKNSKTKEAYTLIVDFAKAINVFLWSRGFWHERIQICNMALESAKKLNNDTEAGRQAYYIGIVNFWQGKSDEAETWAKQSMDFMKKTGSELDTMLANRLNALIKMKRGDNTATDDFKAVLQGLEKYRDINQEGVALFADWIVSGTRGHLVGEVSLLQEIGICYNRQGKFTDAETSLLESKKLATDIGDDEGLSVSLSHLGHSYYGLGKFNEAKTCYLEGFKLAETVQRKSTMARCYEGLSKIYDKKNKKQPLIRYGRIALNLFDKLGMADEYKSLSEIFIKRNINLMEDRKDENHKKAE